MKATVYDLMDAIGNVSDYVVMETSARSRQVKERAHIRWAVTAACICYVAVMALIGIYKSGLSMIEPPSGMFLPGKEVMGPSDTADAVGTGTDTDAAEPEEHRSCDSILKVLRGEGDFRTSRGEYFDIKHLYAAISPDFADVELDFDHAVFAPIDMDGDGTFEAVFKINYGGENYVILYTYNGEVRSEVLYERSCSSLKADGTFFWWDISEHQGFRRIESFTDSGAVFDYFLYRTPLYGDGCYYTEDGECIKDSSIDLDDYNFETIEESPSEYVIGIVYLVDNEKVSVREFNKTIEEQNASEAEYEKAVEEQNAKDDVTWYDLADMDDLDLEQYFDDVTADTDTTEPREPRPCDSILKVLEGEGEFYNNIRHSDGTYSECLVHIVGDCFYSPYMGRVLKIARFALVDMDGDGIEEAVLDCTLIDDDRYTYETVVLHLYKGEVHSYWFVPRAFYNLKADGTFEWLDGPNGGFRKITSFTDTDSIVDDFTYQDYYSDEGPYFVNNNTVSEDEFEKEYARLREKEDAVWHDFEGADLEQYFE